MAGWFTSGSEGNVGDMEDDARPVELGKDAFADLAGLVRRTLSEEDNNLAKFLIRTLRDDKSIVDEGTKLAFKLFSLNLQTTGADDIVFAAENTETLTIHI